MERRPAAEAGTGLVVTGLAGVLVALATVPLAGFGAAIGLGFALLLGDRWWWWRRGKRATPLPQLSPDATAQDRELHPRAYGRVDDGVRRTLQRLEVDRQADWEAAERERKALIKEGYVLSARFGDSLMHGGLDSIMRLPYDVQEWAVRAVAYVKTERPQYVNELPDLAAFQTSDRSELRALLKQLLRIVELA